MNGVLLTFYVQENRKHRGLLAYEWLLEQARGLGLHGGSAFRAIAGFGHHGVMHEEHFFELAGNLPVQVKFAVSEEEGQLLLDLVRREGLQVFWSRMAIEYGVVGE